MANKTIQKILEDKERKKFFVDGFRLYSPLIGACHLENANLNGTILVASRDEESNFIIDTLMLGPDAKKANDGECMLFPSKSMRDWNKFAWEGYTLIYHRKNRFCFFKEWATLDYEEFFGIEYSYVDGVIKKEISKHETRCYFTCPPDRAKSFYETLFFHLGRHIVTDLAENIPLYRKIAEKLSEAVKEKEKREKEGRKTLKEMSLRNPVRGSRASEFCLVNGEFYYFERSNIIESSIIGEFGYLSNDEKVATFRKALEIKGATNNCLIDLSVETNCCLNFRKATKEEIEKHKSAFVDFGNENCGLLVPEVVYHFEIVTGSSYIGRLISVSDEIAQFSQVVCLNGDGEITSFELEDKGFFKWFIFNIRLATAMEIARFSTEWAKLQRKDRRVSPFYPKQWCLMRNDDSELWELCQFAYDASANAKEDLFVAVGGLNFYQCIPYEGNENLLGTSDVPINGKSE